MIPRFGILLALMAAAALAQTEDPSGRVARINYETGSVTFRPSSADDWSPAVPNYPLTTGDSLWVGNDSQAEMHAGSTAIRMQYRTALSFLNLDDRTAQLSLTQGTIHVRIRNLHDDEIFEVDTPNGAISLLRPGEYRIRTDGGTAITEITVRSGEAEVTSGGTAFPVHPLQSAQIMGPNGGQYNLVNLPPPDTFERWCEDRDRYEEQAQSVRYVPRDMVGYEDLDRYGGWRNISPYGWVWTPTTVSASWAPYRFGHWVWVAPWGWTWVDDMQWGFAPFHYGRWAFASGAWLWVPGRIVERPVYAPALVAFVGGGGFSLSIGVGGGAGIAWFPLGPGEVYRPAYHVSDVYVRNINITHVTVTNINVTNVRYVNQTVQGAVTAVPQQTFVSARPVGQAARVVPANEAARAQVVGTTAAVAPRPESLVARTAAVNSAARPPAEVMQRTVAVRATPPPPPVAFRAQQQALQANQGKPLDPATLGTLRSSPGAAPNAPRIRAAAPASANGAPPVSLPQRNERQIPAQAAPAQVAPTTPAPGSRPAPAAQVQQPVQVPSERQAPAATAPTPAYRPAPVPQPQGQPPAQNRSERPAPGTPAPAPAYRPAPPPQGQPPAQNRSERPTPEAPAPAPAYRPAPAPQGQPPAQSRSERPAQAPAPVSRPAPPPQAQPPAPARNERPAPAAQQPSSERKPQQEPRKNERKD